MNTINISSGYVIFTLYSCNCKVAWKLQQTFTAYFWLSSRVCLNQKRYVIAFSSTVDASSQFAAVIYVRFSFSNLKYLFTQIVLQDTDNTRQMLEEHPAENDEGNTHQN